MTQTVSTRNAYIVKDTKTYMSAEEARFKLAKEGDSNILFVVIPRRTNNRLKERMEEVVNENDWDEVKWILTRSNCTVHDEARQKKNGFPAEMGEWINNFIDRIHLDRIARKYRPCRLVVSAHRNTMEHLAAMLQPDRHLLVDSGHRIFKRVNKNGYIDYSKVIRSRSRKNRILYRLTGFRVFDRKKTDLFTVYSDKIDTKHGIVHNQFDLQRHLFQSKPVGNEAIWISTPIYVMADGVRLEDYIEYIRTALKQVDVAPENLTYIPHPGKQTEEEIEIIREKTGCKIDSRDIPVEMKINRNENLPQICISPFSSALVNISAASEGRIKLISAWHPEFSFFKTWADWRKEVEETVDLDISFVDVAPCIPLFNISSENGEENPIYNDFKDWVKTNS